MIVSLARKGKALVRGISKDFTSLERRFKGKVKNG
jgi:hypothetical protein